MGQGAEPGRIETALRGGRRHGMVIGRAIPAVSRRGLRLHGLGIHMIAGTVGSRQLLLYGRHVYVSLQLSAMNSKRDRFDATDDRGSEASGCDENHKADFPIAAAPAPGL